MQTTPDRNMKINYTLKELIDICDKSIVPYKKWMNRDTPSSISQMATCRAYLLAGCDFRIRTIDKFKETGTNDRTIWLDIKHYEFEDEGDWHLYYLPTEKRLKEVKGLDWY